MHLLRLSPILPALLLLLTISACRKEHSQEGAPPDPEPPPTVIVQTSVEGRVLNEQLQPVQNATVSGGGESTTTDVNGHFLLENVDLPDNAAVISVEKNGYFKGYRTLMVRKDQTQYIQVELLLENQADINAATGDIIAFLQGTLTFPANAVLSGDNQPYNGQVTVRSIYIDPEGGTFADQMPGDLRGIGTNQKETGLRAFSMILFTMEDGAGAAVFPDPNKPVAVRIMIPSALSASAPQEIPLWHFDETTGFWKEEGVATRQGTDYVGNATKTGYWLCATTIPQITLTAQVVDQRGSGVSNMRVTLLTKNNFIPTYGFTNRDGIYYGKVPSGNQLIMVITSNCSTVLHQQEIGPFNAATEIDNISVPLPQNITLVINGKAKDCDNFNVVTGKVIVNVDNRNYSANITLGNFSLTVLRCSDQPANLTFIATDGRINRTSTTTMNVTSGTITPTLDICN
ncbi:carboxypeptidase-like regulatory domain-containing protein [Chitinophaga sp. S165]|uniref:carboxypeptidase-like regulatory domain-containing protein n=1 Tax=Chitinophaga sp. S165 TaxID=2135462 RepID=UPI000D70D539|nr:carboxypeptidase-like regulatory domain-containing protein [Chitinophaga sp. S165]PWV53812.1 uncharacterized protein UPF0560 [Chitinophaga sp. S165]